MNTKGILILGLGPGNPEFLTREAWKILEECSEIYLRTAQHPVVPALPAKLQRQAFDYFYEESHDFEEVYSKIVARVLELGRRPQGVIYAVPGHPLVAEATCPEIIRRAQAERLPVRVVEGLSFLEPCLTALGIDPLPQLALVDALELAVRHVPTFPTSFPALIVQLHSRAVASDVKLTLMSLYPDEHPVWLVHAAGSENQVVETLSLYEIDRSDRIGLLTALYLPPLRPETSFEAFLEVVAHLRSPEGCLWDRQQTHRSLRKDLLEETYEALAAIDADDPGSLKEELGDLLLLILMQAQIASDEGEFSIADVLSGIHTKIVRRHPHVFGDIQVDSTGAILRNWERLKAEERAANGNSQASLLDGIPEGLPALAQAEKYQQRAARVGFDWPDVQGVLEKLSEEIEELRLAADKEARASELGDLLFALVNLARWLEVDAESALRETNNRFRRRFSYIEKQAREQGKEISQLSLDEMEAFWQEAKNE